MPSNQTKETIKTQSPKDQSD